MTLGGSCYFYTHFGRPNSILMSNLKTHGSWLMAHLRAIIHICQKTRKVGFGVSGQKKKLYTYLYSNKIQNTKMMI